MKLHFIFCMMGPENTPVQPLLPGTYYGDEDEFADRIRTAY